MQFEDLKLIEPLLRAVHAVGYHTPTPIQQQAIPHVMEGKDLLGCAQTGTGKTAAFALPILQHLSASPRRERFIRALVLAPTRELASQIAESFRVYGKNTPLRTAVIFGGVGQNPQVDAIRRGPEVLVATPGRLLDLMGQGYIRLDRLEILVLDEADRMLDMGFIHDVRRVIAAVPRQRQTLLFSATMPNEIQDLANNILVDPVHVAVTPVASTVDTIQQSVFFVEKKDKLHLLAHLLENRSIRRVLVFTRTKHGANKVVKQLDEERVTAEAIHGNKSQSAREKALSNFKAGHTRVLVATDIAARGLDVDDITHIINYDLPNEPETYVHRIGRTARAGASGVAYSFCEVEERDYLVDIERLIQKNVRVQDEHPYLSQYPSPKPTDLTRRIGQRSSAARPSYNRGPRGNGNGGGSGNGQRRDGNGGGGSGNGSGQRRDGNGSGGYNQQRDSGHTPDGGGQRRGRPQGNRTTA
jgi:ATP-dependent RNA helicase RhlE